MWKSTALAIIFAVPVVSNTDCGGCDPSGGNSGTDDTAIDDTGTDDTGDTEPVDPCASYVGFGTAQDAATPRAYPELELMAIDLVGGFTADPDVYGRLERDISEAWGLSEPYLGDITYRPDDDGRHLVVAAGASTLQAMANGTYTDWDCANDWYEMVDIKSATGSVVVEFEGTYDLDALAVEYANLPNVTFAEPQHVLGDGPTICVTIDGDTYHYVFDEATNDCPSGCIDHTYYYFTTDSDTDFDADPLEPESWSNSQPPFTKPTWVDLYGC